MDSFKSIFNTVLNKKVLYFGLFATLLIALPAVILLAQNPQDNRQKAAENITVTLNPVSDTYVDAANPSTANGSKTFLQVKGGTQPQITYLKFDLSTLNGKSITAASLRLMVTNESAGNQSLKSVGNTSWTEAITYTNRPILGSQFASFGNTALNAWKSINVLNKINEKKGDILSFAIDSASTDLLIFKSKEASSDKPRLVVTYTDSMIPPSSTPTISPTTVPAPTTPPLGGSCSSSAAVDVVLVIDTSASMGQEIKQAKEAAKIFVDKVAQNAQNKIALVTFADDAATTQFTHNYITIKSAIDNITSLTLGTCAQCGINAVNAEFAARGRSGVKKAIVLLTDGRANRITTGPSKISIAEAAAIQSIKTGYNAYGYTAFTIGLGLEVNTDFLTEIANVTGGKYYFSPTINELDDVYISAASVIGKGSVTGTVFYDEDADGTKDASESALQGWNVTIKEGNGPILATATTTTAGGYDFTGLCEGKTYTVGQVVKPGWRQTAPPNNGSYSLTVINANSFENKDFGNTKIEINKCAPDTLSGWPECRYKLPSYNLEACRQHAERFKGVSGPESQDDTAWFTWAQSEPKPLSCGTACGVAPSYCASRCSDTKDNDENGFIDINDSTCHTDGNPNNPDSYDPEKNGEIGGGNTCADSRDNNGNNLIDGADPVCHTDGNAGNPQSYDPNLPESAPARCSDNIDNDNNGVKDENDSTCHTDGNPNNPDSYDPDKNGENGGGNTCADSRDNNGNNLIDGADPVCHTDGNAGNPQSYDPNRPEDTPEPGDIIFNLNVFLHGIGSSGDNRNPDSQLSNKNPLHPERSTVVEVFNNSNQLVASSEAVIKYASSSGNFLGTANIGKSLAKGNYTVKIKTARYLRNQYQGIIQLDQGITVDLAPISLVTGDVNNDNKLDILDYNILYGCYTSDLFPTPRNCNPENTVKADLDDEGNVNLFDLNLFIRELSVQSGL